MCVCEGGGAEVGRGYCRPPTRSAAQQHCQPRIDDAGASFNARIPHPTSQFPPSPLLDSSHQWSRRQSHGRCAAATPSSGARGDARTSGADRRGAPRPATRGPSAEHGGVAVGLREHWPQCRKQPPYQDRVGAGGACPKVQAGPLKDLAGLLGAHEGGGECNQGAQQRCDARQSHDVATCDPICRVRGGDAPSNRAICFCQNPPCVSFSLFSSRYTRLRGPRAALSRK